MYINFAVKRFFLNNFYLTTYLSLVSGRVAQPGQGGNDAGSNLTIAMIFMLVAVFMYVVSPSTWRQFTTSNKPIRRDNNQDGSPPPPQPPPAIN